MTQLSLFDKQGRIKDEYNKALEKVKVFDNKGKTFDRYFVVIDGETYIMSHNPLSPQGVNQYIGPDETSGRPWIAGWDSRGAPLDHIPPEIEPAILKKIEGLGD